MTTKKESIYRKLAEDSLYDMLLTTGETLDAIDNYQKKRVLKSVGVTLVVLIGLLLLKPTLLILSIPIGVFYYKRQYRKLENKYRVWLFNRNLEFIKFQRLLIPYLRMGEGQEPFFTILEKVRGRINNDHIKREVDKLMAEINIRPGEIDPYVRFAERAGGTDSAVLFMSTVYDFQNITRDVEVIESLGKSASQELMESIDEIKELKLRRFGLVSTKIVMTSFILVLGFTLSMLIDSLKTIGW